MNERNYRPYCKQLSNPKREFHVAIEFKISLKESRPSIGFSINFTSSGNSNKLTTYAKKIGSKSEEGHCITWKLMHIPWQILVCISDSIPCAYLTTVSNMISSHCCVKLFGNRLEETLQTKQPEWLILRSPSCCFDICFVVRYCQFIIAC